MKINFIRECINNRICEVVFVPTDLNVADTLTKPLAIEKFELFSNIILTGFGGDISHLLKGTTSHNEVAHFIDKMESTQLELKRKI
jgi:hypothetical protein